MNFRYSFVIPHKNTPSLVKRCVESIPEREDIQIIVVDDNSDDDKKPSFDREGVEVVLLDKDHAKGAGRARNVGLAKASGKWVLFADADDFYKVGFLDVLDAYYDKEIDVLYFNADSVNSDTLESAGRTAVMQSYFDKYDDSDLSLKSIKYGPHFPWNKMTKLSFLKKWNISFEEVPKGNDTLFSYCVGYFASSVEIEKRPVYVYTFTSGSLTTQQMTLSKWIVTLTNYFKQTKFLKFVGCNHLAIPLTRFIWRLAKNKGYFNVFIAVWVLVTHYRKMKLETLKYVNVVRQLEHLV